MRPIILAILLILTKFTYAQLRYEDWAEKKMNKRVAEMWIWKHNLQTDSGRGENFVSKQITLVIDTIKIDSQLIIDTSILIPPNTKPSGINTNDSILWNHSKYNKKGLLVYQEGYFMHIDYNRYLYKSFVYDKKNRLIKRTETNNDSTLSETYEYIFDDKKKTVRLNQAYNMILQEYTIWIYGPKGEIISITNYWNNGRIQDVIRFEYSNNAHEIKSVNNRFEGYVIFKVGEKHKLLESSYWQKDSLPIPVSINTYNKAGSIIEERKLEQNGTTKAIVSYEYDPNNNLLKMYSLDRGQKKILKEERDYSNNLLNYIIYYDQNGIPLRKMSYKYSLAE